MPFLSASLNSVFNIQPLLINLAQPVIFGPFEYPTSTIYCLECFAAWHFCKTQFLWNGMQQQILPWLLFIPSGQQLHQHGKSILRQLLVLLFNGQYGLLSKSMVSIADDDLDAIIINDYKVPMNVYQKTCNLSCCRFE